MIDNTSSIESASLASKNAVNIEQVNQSTQSSNRSTYVETDNTQAQQSVAKVNKGVDGGGNQVDSEQLSQIVESLNAFVQLTKRNVSFTIDKESGRDVISVFDAETQELIRQIPSEEALALLKRMDEAVGLLFSEKV